MDGLPRYRRDRGDRGRPPSREAAREGLPSLCGRRGYKARNASPRKQKGWTEGKDLGFWSFESQIHLSVHL